MKMWELHKEFDCRGADTGYYHVKWDDVVVGGAFYDFDAGGWGVELTCKGVSTRLISVFFMKNVQEVLEWLQDTTEAIVLILDLPSEDKTKENSPKTDTENKETPTPHT